MATTYDNDKASDLGQAYAATFEPFDEAMDSDALIAEAGRATGLSDLGGKPMGEPGFRKRLAALCTSLENESQLTPLGTTRAHARVLAMLISRLRTVDYVRQSSVFPEISAPLIGTGMPRSGTSFLQALLAQDPENLVPRTGHAMVPIPPPGVLADEADRMDLVQRMLTFQGLDSDEVNAVHPFAPDAEDEDVLFQEAACGGLFQAFFNIPSFMGAFQPHYDELFSWQKQLMQIIQSSQSGKRWVLKAPEYMGQIDLVRRMYPDGMIFVNHRDPARVVASIASLYVTFQSLNSVNAPPPEYLGPPMLEGQARALKAYEDWRAANPDVKVLDIHYKSLVADPIGTAESLYSDFGLKLADEARDSMTNFLSVNRHGQASSGVKHSYSLADFGVTEDMIEETFGNYIDRNGIERERR